MWSESGDVIEPVPVDDVFITGLCRIEDVGSGVIRWWGYSQENSSRIVRCKLVIPIACAVAMNQIGRSIYAHMMREHPEIATLIH